jgi:hypothetical protein
MPSQKNEDNQAWSEIGRKLKKFRCTGKGQSCADLSQRFRLHYKDTFSTEQQQWFPAGFVPPPGSQSLARKIARFEQGQPGRHPRVTFRAACIALDTSEEEVAGHDWCRQVGLDRTTVRWPGIQDSDSHVRSLAERNEIAGAHLDLLESAPDYAQVFQTFICANSFPLTRDIATSGISEEKALSFERIVGVSRAIDVNLAAHSLELASDNRKMALRLLNLAGPAEMASVYPNFLLIGDRVLLTFSNRFPEDSNQLTAHGVEVRSDVSAKHFKQYFAELRKCCANDPGDELEVIKDYLWQMDRRTYLIDLARAFALELEWTVKKWLANQEILTYSCYSAS